MRVAKTLMVGALSAVLCLGTAAAAAVPPVELADRTGPIAPAVDEGGIGVDVSDQGKHEAERAVIPAGSNVVVKSEKGTSSGSYVELTRETSEQRNSILVFPGAHSDRSRTS